jgi:hypothetical protein
MEIIERFEEFVSCYGRLIFNAQRTQRNRLNHGGQGCRGGGSYLIGGRGGCHECESNFGDLLMKMFREGGWLYPEGWEASRLSQAQVDIAA